MYHEPGTATDHGRSAVGISGGVKEYGRGQARVQALAGVTLAVPEGAWLAVMGPSGSGKSTLLHCLAGLERLDGGRVYLAGADITGASEKELTELRRIRVGFVFQNFNLIGALTAEQNVALPLRLAGRGIARQEVRDVLDAVGIGDRARHRPSQLSGGQQQRVAIARAMATRPDVLFADEPTGALDSGSSRLVLGLMRDIASRGQTIVMVTHDPIAAARADAVVFLRDGALAGRMDAPTPAEVASRITELEDAASRADEPAGSR